MKKIFTIIITVVLLIITIALSVGAVSHNNGEAGTGEYLPWLNYTVTAETDTTNVVIFGAPVLSSTYHEVMQTLSEYTVNNTNYVLPYIDIESLGLTKVSGLDIYRGTIAYRVPNLAIDNVTPISTVGNTVTFDPFSIKFEHGFDSETFKISDVIGSFNWYGVDIVDTTIIFRMGVRVSYVDYDNVLGQPIVYRAKQKYYELEFVHNVDAYFWSTDDVDETTIAVRNVTDDTNISYSDFVNEVQADTYLIDNDARWVDVESLSIDFTYSGGGTAQFVHQHAQYAVRSVYNDANSMFYGDVADAVGGRQKYTAHWIALQEGLNLQRSAYQVLWDNTQGGTVVGDRLSQMIGIFSGTVGALFDIDLFGVGITLGHVTLVVLLAGVVVVFLRLFAGG